MHIYFLPLCSFQILSVFYANHLLSHTIHLFLHSLIWTIFLEYNQNSFNNTRKQKFWLVFDTFKKITVKKNSFCWKFFFSLSLLMIMEKRSHKGSFLSFFDSNGKSPKKLYCHNPNLPGNYF